MREIVELLRTPQEIEAIELEADDAGSIDDVLVRYRNSRRRHLQVKLAVHATSDWSWDNLSTVDGKPKPRKAPTKTSLVSGGQNDILGTDSKSDQQSLRLGLRARSLIFKWFDSILNLDANDKEAVGEIVTNRAAAPDLAASLSADGTLNFDDIPEHVRAELIGRYTEAGARRAAARLYFKLEQDGPSELEERIRHDFALLVDASHFESFKNAVHSWGSSQPYRSGAKVVDIGEARRVAGFYQAVPLPENFHVPADFVLPDRNADNELLTRLAGPEPALLLLTSDAGAGKSTYVSDLYQRMRSSKRIVLRHHFWLSADDPSTDRVTFEPIATALMSQLRATGIELLGSERAAESPSPSRLDAWLSAAAAKAVEQGTALIVLVDGLDHALRPENEVETNRVLTVLVARRPGLKTVIASRPDQFPSCLTDRNPVRIDLPRMQRAAVAEILHNNANTLDLPPLIQNPQTHDDSFDEIVDALLSRTGGLALHVRTALRYLQKLHRRIRAADVAALPAELARGAQDFNERNWPRLPQNGQLVLHVLGEYAWPWQATDLVTLLGLLKLSPAEGLAAVDSISQLLEKSPDGFLTLHFSLFTFVRSRPEHALLAKQIDAVIYGYLETAAPEEWRWAYLPMLQIRDGRINDVISTLDRSWFVRAIADGRAAGDVRRIAMATMQASLRARNLPGFLTVGTLYDYYDSAYTSDSSSFATLETLHLLESMSERSRPRDATTSTVLCDVVVALAQKEPERASAFYDELVRRFEDLSSRDQITEDIFSATMEPVFVAAGGLGKGSDRTGAVILANADTGYAGRIARAYLLSAARAGQTAAVWIGLEAAVGAGARVDASDAIAVGALASGMILTEDIRAMLEPSLPSVRLILSARGFAVSPGQRYPVIPGLKEYITGPVIRSRWREAFFDLMADAFSGTTTTYDDLHLLLSLRPSTSDVADGLTEIWQLCRNIASRAKSTSFADSLASASSVVKPQHVERDDYREEQMAWGFRAAFCDLLLDCANAQLIELLRASDVASSLSGGLSLNVLVESLIGREKAAERDALELVIHSSRVEIDSSLDERETRAGRYAQVARIAYKVGSRTLVREISLSAGRALMSYGYHKDVLLDIAIDGILAVGDRFTTAVRPLLVSLAKPIASILTFTDGDHTNHFPTSLGMALLRLDPDRFLKYYYWLIERDGHFTLDGIRHRYLAIAKSSDESVALLRTIRDLETITTVANRENQDALAMAARNALELPQTQDGTSESRGAPTDPVSTVRQVQFLDPKSLPPDKLLSLGSDDRFRVDVALWCKYWLKSGRSSEASVQMRKALREGFVMQPTSEVYETFLELRGLPEAYEVLTLTVGWTGWTPYSDNSRTRAEGALQEHHRDRAGDFVFDSLIAAFDDRVGIRPHPSMMGSALVEHLVTLGRPDEALTLVECMVDLCVQLTSAWRLPDPAWLSK
jgi:hypothetical protein